MTFWQRLFGGRKVSEARSLLAISQVGRPAPTPRNYEAFSKEGYQANVIAYKCVSVISRACGGIKWDLYQNDREIESSPLLDLMKKPNPLQGWSGFMESVTAYYLIAGNSYIEAVGSRNINTPPIELWPLRPDKMRVVPGRYGIPQAFEFSSNSGSKVFPVDPVTGESEILQLKTFHPTDNWYGLSPIEAAMYSIDQHNASGKWNLALLQNDAKPSGALIVKQDAANPMGVLPPPQYENLKQQIMSKYAGADNAGRMLLLEGGVDWKEMGLSPKDMDWMEGRKMAARDVALAFGVPPIILNIPGDSTFANYKEARVALYEDTIIPYMDYLQDELNKWLVSRYGDGLVLKYDIDSIEALAIKRSEKFNSVNVAGFLTINEKRAATGYEPIEGGDILLVNSGQIPINDLSAEGSLDADDESAGDNANEESTPNNTQENEGAEPQSASDGEQDDIEDDATKHIKATQLTRGSQEATWRKINKRRRELERAMEDDIGEELSQQAKKLGQALSKVSDPRLYELTAIKIINDNSKDLEKIIKKYVKRSIKEFAAPILGLAKTWSPEDYESKTLVKFNDFVEKFVDAHAAQSVSHIDGTSIRKARAKIKDVLSRNLEEGTFGEQNIARELTDELEGLVPSRAKTIARTEISVASNQGSLEAAKALDIPDLRKEWVSVQDDRTRDGESPGEADHLDMNGVTVKLDEKFTVPPDASMDGPGDPSAEAGQIINCRCVLVYSRGE